MALKLTCFSIFVFAYANLTFSVGNSLDIANRFNFTANNGLLWCNVQDGKLVPATVPSQPKIQSFAVLQDAKFIDEISKNPSPQDQIYFAPAEEYFMYTNDDGFIVPALIEPEPEVLTLEDVSDRITFWFYKNGTDKTEIKINCTNCLKDVEDELLLVIVHGFHSSVEGKLVKLTLEALKNYTDGPTNALAVDWKELAKAPKYTTAANNTEHVGSHTAKMLNYLIEKKLATKEKIYFIGHSIGCHVANFIAQNNGPMEKIFALDPTYPVFANKTLDKRLDKTDGNRVIVLHTAMGKLVDRGFSFFEAIGHVDYFPNSGKCQPGCWTEKWVPWLPACSHMRSISYFVESILKPEHFKAYKCNNWDDYKDGKCKRDNEEYMGWHTKNNSTGSYYLYTNDNAPYGIANGVSCVENVITVVFSYAVSVICIVLFLQ